MSKQRQSIVNGAHADSKDSVLEVYKTSAKEAAGARTRLYPNAPATTTAPSLPIGSYSGSFRHPGYGKLDLQVEHDDEGDFIHCLIKSTFDRDIKLRHINAEHWLGTTRSGRSAMEIAIRAKSRLSVNGRVEAWEIAMEPAMPDTMMDFERVKD